MKMRPAPHASVPLRVPDRQLGEKKGQARKRFAVVALVVVVAWLLELEEEKRGTGLGSKHHGSESEIGM